MRHPARHGLPERLQYQVRSVRQQRDPDRLDPSTRPPPECMSSLDHRHSVHLQSVVRMETHHAAPTTVANVGVGAALSLGLGLGVTTRKLRPARHLRLYLTRRKLHCRHPYPPRPSPSLDHWPSRRLFHSATGPRSRATGQMRTKTTCLVRMDSNCLVSPGRSVRCLKPPTRALKKPRLKKGPMQTV